MADDSSMITSIIDQENALLLSRMSYDDAWWLGSRLHDKAKAAESPIAIVVSLGRTTVFQCVMPGATADNLGWIERKAATVWRFQQSSYATNLKFRSGDNMFERFGLDHKTYAAAGGAVPIRVAGAGMVGVVAVSGLPQAEDHALVIEALQELRAYLEQGK